MKMNKAKVKRSYKEIEEDLIYRNRSHGYYFPMEEVISVYDREENNVIKSHGIRYPGEDLLPETETFTVSEDILNKIRNLIRNSGVLEIKSFENVDYVVMDGEANTFYFCADGKRKLIECDNFYMLYDGFGKETNAGKVIQLIEDIEAFMLKLF